MRGTFTAFLRPGAALGGFDAGMPPEPAPAIAGAIWAAVLLEVVSGRVGSLAALAPEVTRLAVGPLNRRG